ncbi:MULTISPECIES: hypothetical protein [Achromobacter]|uniref:Uncharacterized protein n=1 Tax=Achromobacter spanius TaxID=217203 RepID=A0ABY8GV29_9BURK|nr:MULTISPECIES: hypothetical protein [Achromobacter]WAI82037.1 hypothetical protein N8Z00_21235 [Achromobacter spanius]WEX92125.1 hypothetical protein N3Z32_15845 [Achromobacter sp. SS2-2022]WFP08728.1 hypothetical protein P8T11_02285 [Achromobacter spanius]
MSPLPVLARLCLVGLLAPSLAFALPPPDPELIAKSKAAAERTRENRDSGLAEFVQEGMALLVIPTLNLDDGPKRDFDDRATREKFLRQQSMLTRWNHKTDHGLAITVGHGAHKLDILDTGPLFQTAHGRMTYQVIPVWPGEYQLDRITYHVPNTTIPRMTWHPDTTALLQKIGMSTMRYRDDDVFKKTGPWPQPKNPTDDGLGEGCQVVLRLGGGCDEAAREFRWQRSAELAVTEGTAELDSAAGLDVDLTFEPIASIKLEAGEVVLTDGFVPMEGQPVLIKQMCEPGGDQVRCAMQSITVERLSTSVQDFRQAPSAASFNMPKLNGVLDKLVYRAPTLHMKPVDKASPNVMRAEPK